MISNYKVKVNDSCNYKVSITDIQNKYKFKLFCAGADLTDYYTKEQVDQSQNTQDILIDNLLNQIPTGTATGETINITDSSSLPLKDIQVAGNTYQETTTGKNLYYISPQTKNGVTLNYDSDGAIVLSGTSTGSFVALTQDVSLNGTFTLSTNNAITQANVFVRTRDLNGILLHSIPLDSTSGSVTKTGGISKFEITIGSAGIVFDNFKIYAQLEQGSTATSYEKYSGGNPAPSPDYPQTISNVTGTNTIKINGKNLFDGILEIGNFNSNTGEKIANNDYIINTNPIPVEELTNYKISSNGTGIRMYVFEYKEDMTYNLSVRKTVNADSYLTTNSGTKYINFRTIDANTNLQEKIQVEKGSTASTYEAYKEQSYTINLGDIELCKISTYKDRIYPLNGKWYLHEEIGKVVLDGSEAWGTAGEGDTTNGVSMYWGISDAIAVATKDLISDYFRFIPRSSVSSTTINFITGGGGNSIVLNIAKTSLETQTLAGFKTWLSTHNAIVYYPLATPTTTEITDATLIGQLDALLNSTTYKTTTNITVDTTNQQPTLTLTYRKDLETLIGG